MWRTQSEHILTDLSNEFFIAKLYRKEEYEGVLLDGPWMIGENYLHAQRWKPNFRADREEINSMPVWMRFSILSVEYYTEGWLKRAGDRIGRMLRVDIATLLASRG